MGTEKPSSFLTNWHKILVLILICLILSLIITFLPVTTYYMNIEDGYEIVDAENTKDFKKSIVSEEAENDEMLEHRLVKRDIAVAVDERGFGLDDEEGDPNRFSRSPYYSFHRKYNRYRRRYKKRPAKSNRNTDDRETEKDSNSKKKKKSSNDDNKDEEQDGIDSEEDESTTSKPPEVKSSKHKEKSTKSKDKKKPIKSDDLKKHLKKEKSSKSSSNKTKTAKEKAEAKQNASLLNPKPPLDLPIVKPEIQKLENEPAAKLIPTKGKPFHFHVPLVSKNPEPKLSQDELLKLAKKYKDPLTLDPVIMKAAATGKILTEKQLSSIKRMVRGVPILDFLRLPTISALDKEDLEHLMGDKREVVHIMATDELLQELVGDTDDLISFSVEDEYLAKRSIPLDEQLKAVEIERSIDALQPKAEQMPRKKRVLQEYEFNDQAAHHRSRRGLGRWLKKIFGKKDPTTTTTPIPTTKKTTTTTTEKPKSDSDSDSDESDELKKKKKKSKKKSKKHHKKKDDDDDDAKDKMEKKVKDLQKKAKENEGKLFIMIVDENGDSEADFLLPKDLRRSTWLKLHENDVKIQESEKAEQESQQKEPTKKKGLKKLFGN